MRKPLRVFAPAFLFPLLWAQSPAISPVEAIHLVEAHVKNLTVTSLRLGVEKDLPVYHIEGRLGADRYQAVVDAKVARTLRIRKNAAPFYEWPGVLVVAHRGAARHAPENTLAAFRKAIQLGADLIEFDVRETKDGQLVVMHDETVNRTTDGQGRVSELTLDEIKKLDAGSRFGPEFQGERVPTLDEALEVIKAGALPDLDFKAGSPEKLVAAVARHGLLGKATLYCGEWNLLRRTLAVSSQFLIRPSVPVGLLGLPILIRELDPPIVNVDWPQFTERLVVEAHLAGRKVFLNTMGPNETEFGIARMVEAGPDYIQSDRFDLLMPMLRARGWRR